MYGLVNRGIVKFAIAQGGDDAWEAIRTKAGVTTSKFLSMETYPDKTTYDLVAAASEVFALPTETILREFGRFWVKFVGQEGYGSLINMLGTDLYEMLGNLDSLHQRVLAGMPHLNPPSFSVDPIDSSGTFRLHYHSTRPGLLPMVVGLIEALAESRDQAIEISVSDESTREGHNILTVSLLDTSSPSSNAVSSASI